MANKTITGWLRVENQDPGSVATVVRGAANQTADLFQARNSAEGVLLTVDKDGNLGIGVTTLDMRLELADANTIETGLELTNTSAGGKAWRIRTLGSGLQGQGRVGNLSIRNASEGINVIEIKPTGEVGIGTSTPQAKLHVNGDVVANNNVKVWDSGWFAISALQAPTKNHNLGTAPKFVIVWCAQSASPTRMSVAGPFHVDSGASPGTNVTGAHTHGGAVASDGDHGHTIPERGAYIAKVDATSLEVRAGNYIGINENGDGWLTSGYYKIIAWA